MAKKTPQIHLRRRQLDQRYSMQRDDLYHVPTGLPVPMDDGATDHLVGSELPAITLAGTDERTDYLRDAGRRSTVFFFYPRTGQPHVPAPDGWDAIPGARGCTPQNAAYRDKYAEFNRLGVHVFGVSVQSSAYQQEFAKRNHIPFPILSDEGGEWVRAARLPTFDFNGQTLTKRFTLFVEGGIVKKVFYPVFPSDKDAEIVLSWLNIRISCSIIED